MVKGIFLGYQFNKGGKWRGEYHVTSLRELVLGVIVPHRTTYVTVTREIEWNDKELPRFPAGYAIKRAKAINSLTVNRDEVVSRVEAEVDMYMELCPDTDESEYSSASEVPDSLVREESAGGKGAAQVLNQGTADDGLTDEIPDAAPSSHLPAERQKIPKYDTGDIVEDLTFEEIQKLRQWEDSRPEKLEPLRRRPGQRHHRTSVRRIRRGKGCQSPGKRR